VWEDPDPQGYYVIGADPAYGSSDEADRFVVSVWRAYADGLDQVAEYCHANVKAFQFAWIVAHLAGAYGQARLLLELNGPGEAVFTEWRNLQSQIASGIIRPQGDDKSFKNVLAGIRTYFYKRPDSMAGASALHWKTNLQNKVTICNQFRDGFSLGQIKIRSVPLLDEMQKMVQTGMTIKGEGTSKDDRVIAAALATRCWIDAERKRLQNLGLTRGAIAKRDETSQEDLSVAYTGQIVQDFMARQAALRKIKAIPKQSYRNW
jgi:hypothetical protein